MKRKVKNCKTFSFQSYFFLFIIVIVVFISTVYCIIEDRFEENEYNEHFRDYNNNNNYSTIWVNCAANYSNKSNCERGYSKDCAVKTINEALLLINTTFRIIEVSACHENTYQEQISINYENVGEQPLYLRGELGNTPTLKCPLQNSTIVVNNATFYVENVKIIGCQMKNIQLSSHSSYKRSECTNILSTETNSLITDGWNALRDTEIEKANQMRRYYNELASIFFSEQPISEKIKLYKELLKKYEYITGFETFSNYSTIDFDHNNNNNNSSSMNDIDNNEMNNNEKDDYNSYYSFLLQNYMYYNNKMFNDELLDNKLLTNDNNSNLDEIVLNNNDSGDVNDDDDDDEEEKEKKEEDNHSHNYYDRSDYDHFFRFYGDDNERSTEINLKNDLLEYGNDSKTLSNYAAILVLDGELHLRNITIEENEGSLLISYSTGLEMKHISMIDVVITNNFFGIGFGLFFYHNTVDIQRMKIVDNIGKVAINIFGYCNVTIDWMKASYNSNIYGVASFVDSIIKIRNSVIAENVGSPAGFEFISSKTIISRTSFEANNVNYLYDYDFGVIVNLNSDLSVLDCSFDYNYSQFCGGTAIYHKDTTMNEKFKIYIENSEFNDNTAVNGNGGAIEILGGDIHFFNTSFTLNSATNGGSVYIDGSYKRIDTVDIDSCYFEGNIALFGGGAVLLQSCNNTKLTINNSIFESNLGEEGGVIRITQIEKEVIIQNSFFSNNYASDGGVFYFYNLGYLLLFNNTFGRNIAENAAVSFFRSCLNVNDQSNLYYRNYALNVAGVTYFEVSNLFYDSNEFIQNIANLRDASTIYVGVRSSANITNSHFLNNLALFGDGGISLSYVSNLTMSDCVIDNNYARRGAAIALFADSNCNVKNSIIKNQMSEEGAIYVAGSSSPYFKNTIIRGNNSTSIGGGVTLMERSNSIFEDCIISDNLADTSGGGIHMGGRVYANFTNTFILNNRCLSSGGGVLITDMAKSEFFNTTFFNNSANSSGGGIIGASLSKLLFYNCTIHSNIGHSSAGGVGLLDGCESLFYSTIFENNFTPNDGGAMAFTDCSNATLIGCKLINNYAGSDGGGIAATVTSETFIYDCEIINNKATSKGGGLSFSDTTKPRIENSLIASNYALTGGGMQIIDTVQLTMSNTVFLYNNASTQGGGLFCSDQSISYLTKLLFNQNYADKGGGLVIAQFATIHINDSLFSNNSANIGGAVTCSGASRGEFENCTFLYNYAYYGGALTTEGLSLPSIHHCSVLKNGAITGGGFTIKDKSFPTIENTLFSHNFASQNGGAIAIADLSTPKMNDCKIMENNAFRGGAIYLSQFVNSTLTNLLIENNFASFGGGLFVYSYLSILKNISFHHNECEHNGAGLYLLAIQENSTSTFENFEFFHNVAHGDGGALYVLSINSTPQQSFHGYSLNLDYDDSSFYSSSSDDDDDLSFNPLHYQNNNNNDDNYNQSSFTSSSSLNYTIQYELHLNNDDRAMNMSQQMINNYFYNQQPINDFDYDPYYYYLDYNNGYYGDIDDDGDGGELENFSPSFKNLMIVSNAAKNGGGIFYAQYGSQNISFGPVCEILHNNASQYGGGVFIEVDLSSEILLTSSSSLYSAKFIGNSAIIGGGSVATNSEYNMNEFGAFCFNCSYLNNTSGYQTEEGFCSIPRHVTALSYPNSLTLNNQTFSVTVVLQDSFNETVIGECFKDTFLVTLFTKEDDCFLSFQNHSKSSSFIDYQSGTTTFTNLLLQGKNGSICELTLNTTIQNSSLAYDSIQDSSFQIALSGCNNPIIQKIKTSTVNTNIEYCYVDFGFWNIENLLLILMLITLFFASSLLIWIFFLILNLKKKERKKRKRRKNEMFRDIPDFHDQQSKITLDQILNDPEILVIPWSDLEKKERLGIGAGGVVYSALWFVHSSKDQPRHVAIKELFIGRSDNLSEETMHQFLIEIKLLSALKNKHVVEFLGVSSPSPNTLCLVTELMNRGSVDDVISQKRDNLPLKLRLKLLIGAAKGVLYLHSRNIIHRDLKPSNLLVDENWNCKVGDLGVSTIKPALTKTMTVIGTPIYMAPEVIGNQKYSESCDVYSFSILMVEILSGVQPYSTLSNDLLQAQLLYRICNDGLRPSISSLSSPLKQLAVECWNPSPSLRPSMPEVLSRLKRISNELNTNHKRSKEKGIQKKNKIRSNKNDNNNNNNNNLHHSNNIIINDSNENDIVYSNSSSSSSPTSSDSSLSLSY